MSGSRPAYRASSAPTGEFVTGNETSALIEAARHQPEPGGCTCGFCAWSVEHVVIMSVRAVLNDQRQEAMSRD